MGPICIFQKNFAFTTADSERTQIKTGPFGPCYVVTFTSVKFAAMAHIDDQANVDSMSAIFEKFLENSVNPKDIKVIVLGGWKEHPESYIWGQKILNKILNSNFQNVSTTNMHSKKALTPYQEMYGMSPSEVSDHYHFGATVDSTNGETFTLNEYPEDLDDAQDEQTQKFTDFEGEVPLSQIFK